MATSAEGPNFELFISQLVLSEAGAGDAAAAGRRLELLEGIPLLALTDATFNLAEQLVIQEGVPEAAGGDALHISIAATHGIHYLLTWNCRHIANATMRRKIGDVCRAVGYEPPVLCTPEELLEP